MAFDRPIEADRIDDFNLISAFVRAPLWLLSGFLGSKTSNDDDIVRPSRLDDDHLHSNSCSRSHDQHSSSRGVTSLSASTTSSLHRRDTPPWDAAVFLHGDDPPLMVSDYSAPVAAPTAPAASTGEASTPTGGLKRTKNLSWSDQSGQRLCEYADESMLHEPPTTTSLVSTTRGSAVVKPKPVRSALRRSKSVHSENSTMLDNNNNSKDRTRYIPKMNQNKNGLIMPTRPYGSDPSGNGVESPQWGWYTNLTPPSPEMYQRHPSKTSKKENASNVPPNLKKGPPYCVPAEAKPNQVFQNLQNQAAPIGWTSVPI